MGMGPCGRSKKKKRDTYHTGTERYAMLHTWFYTGFSRVSIVRFLKGPFT